MSSLFIEGTLEEVGEVEQVQDTFRKRDIFVTTLDEKYPQFIKLQLVQNLVALIDPFKPGSRLRLHFNLQGRKFVDKHGKTNSFNNLTIWRIENLDGSPAATSPGQPAGGSTATHDDVLF